MNTKRYLPLGVAVLAVALGIGVAVYDRPKPSAPMTETFDGRQFFEDLVGGTGCGTLNLSPNATIKEATQAVKKKIRDCFSAERTDSAQWGYIDAARDAGCWNPESLHVAAIGSAAIAEMRACLKRRAGPEPEWYQHLQREGLLPMTQGAKP